ncbi:MAG TPA: FAD-dependent oxidoreductase [Negativicutes bacterium]
MSSNEEKGVSRRGFLQTTAIAALGVAAGSLGQSIGSTTTNIAHASGRIPVVETDVVVVGTGIAGCSAALKARQLGAKVVQIDKRPRTEFGGNSWAAGGGFACPPDSGEGYARYLAVLKKKTRNRCREEMIEPYKRARELVGWMKEQGVQFLDPIETPFAIMYTGVPQMYHCMPNVLTAMMNKIESSGINLMWETKLHSLIVNEQNHVAGIRVSDSSGLKEIHASKGVILASGGYTANKQWLQGFVDKDADQLVVRSGRPWETGDGIKACLDIGSMLITVGGMESIHIAGVHPKDMAAANVFSDTFVTLNNKGERFVDEGQGYVWNGKAIMKQPGQEACEIFDQHIYDTSGKGTVGLMKTSQIEIFKADTIEELCAQFGYPGDKARKTIDEFNAAVDTEHHTALGAAVPKSASAVKIDQPPFYAIYPAKPGFTQTFGGLPCNPQAQVLEADGTPIAGLYAAGEIMGGFFYDDYLGGASLVRGLVYGVTAAENSVKG